MRRFSRQVHLLLLSFTLLLGIMGCSSSQVPGGKRPAPTKPPIATTSVAPANDADTLPVFSDWRAGYLGRDGHLHVVTLDGKTDSVGPELLDLHFHGLVVASAGFAPNGHLLVYNGVTGLSLIDVSPSQRGYRKEHFLASSLIWSPDGSMLALDAGQGSLYTLRAAGGHPVPVLGTPGPTPNVGVGQLLGWIDGSHLAVTVFPGGPLVASSNRDTYATGVKLGALDITTGTVREVAQVISPGLGNYSLALSPDGTKALLYNARFRDNPYTPLVDEIDTASGQITSLTGIVQATQSGFTSVAWQPGTQQVAVSTGFAVNGDLKTWLLDLRQDTARQLPLGQYVAGWTPDRGPLILTSAEQTAIGDGPNTITAVTFTSDGQVATTTTLTQKAMTFPFVGFVRTA